MRCTPVNEWQTKRGINQPGQEAKSKGPAIAKAGEDDDDGVLLEGHRPEAKRTYASSYDVSFIFEQLWKKKTVDSNGDKTAPVGCPEVRIPDTIVYKGGFPASWYFHSRVDGRLLKKKPESIYIPKIYETFGAENGTCETQVVACFVGTLETDRGPTNSIVYLDRNRLKDFVFGENKIKEGFLQRFVAPEAVPFDSSARNSTIHATWSPYNCLVEQRVNKAKLDSKRVGTSAKVNVASTRVETIIVSRHTKLHRKIAQQCKLVADHISQTSTDQAEVTAMTCYFKIGKGAKLWFLWASSVSVAPKFQDAFGYIPSLKTFTGRHSPEVLCPEHIGTIEKAADSKAPPNGTGCALCNDTEDGAAAYAVTYKMLADYTEAERDRLLASLRSAAIPDVQSQKTLTRKAPGDLDIKAKSAAIFSVLDLDSDGFIPRVELWSGLVDLGYTDQEMEKILMGGVSSPSATQPPDSLEEMDDSDGSDDMRIMPSRSGNLAHQDANHPVSLAEFEQGLYEAVRCMTPWRMERFDNNVDMVGDVEEVDLFGAVPSSPVLFSFKSRSDPSIHEDDTNVSVEFARKAVRRAKTRQLARKLPKLLANLKNKINQSDLRRIVSMETVTDEFAERKIWVCKECAKRFNYNAKDVFEWSDAKEGETFKSKVRARLRILQDLQELSDPGLNHAYPLGEIPSLCTPRMYQALHSHQERSFHIGPPQITCGATKDLVSQPQNRRCKLPHEVRRKTPLPGLPSIRIETPRLEEQNQDSNMSNLLDRMGLTPRRPAKGRMGGYMAPRRGAGLGTTRSVSFVDGSSGRGGGIEGENSAYSWLPSSSRAETAGTTSSVASPRSPRTPRR